MRLPITPHARKNIYKSYLPFLRTYLKGCKCNRLSRKTCFFYVNSYLQFTEWNQ